MEFFVCPCPGIGNVLLDGKDLGPNKDGVGNLRIKQCDEGLHTLALRCAGGRTCQPKQVQVEIKDTDPICPMEVPFQCV
jgi:hypothetical protein